MASVWSGLPQHNITISFSIHEPPLSQRMYVHNIFFFLFIILASTAQMMYYCNNSNKNNNFYDY